MTAEGQQALEISFLLVWLSAFFLFLIFSVSVPLNLFNVMHKQADLNNPAGGSPAGDQGTLPNNKSDMDAARYVINYCKITQLIQFVWKDQKFVCTTYWSQCSQNLYEVAL